MVLRWLVLDLELVLADLIALIDALVSGAVVHMDDRGVNDLRGDPRHRSAARVGLLGMTRAVFLGGFDVVGQPLTLLLELVVGVGAQLGLRGVFFDCAFRR